jgi:hypothetical protein
MAGSDRRGEAIRDNEDHMSITHILVFTTRMVQPEYAMPLLKDTQTLYTEEGVTDTNPLRVYQVALGLGLSRKHGPSPCLCHSRRSGSHGFLCG